MFGSLTLLLSLGSGSGSPSHWCGEQSSASVEAGPQGIDQCSSPAKWQLLKLTFTVTSEAVTNLPFRTDLLPWPKKLKQARKPNIGACMLDRSRACVTCARLFQFFLARVVAIKTCTHLWTLSHTFWAYARTRTPAHVYPAYARTHVPMPRRLLSKSSAAFLCLSLPVFGSLSVYQLYYPSQKNRYS